MTEQGTYVVIEGNDGTGKSTQVDLLAQYLTAKGHEVVTVEEPGSDDPDKSTPVASFLRSVIKDGSLERDPEINLALFSGARRELWQQKIAPALGRGAYVLAARNYFSTLAYQGSGEGLDEAHILDVTALHTSERYMHPDYMMILTLEDEAVRAQRIGDRGALSAPDTFESRDAAFQARVNQAYVDLAQAHDIMTISCVDGEHKKTIDEVQARIRDVLFGDVTTDRHQ